MRAVVTRPVEDAERIAAPLRDRGVDVLVEPLLTIVPCDGVQVDTTGIQATLLTSANGVRALAAVPGFDRAIPVLAVGDQTAAVARELGFASVRAAEGDVTSLAALVRATLKPDDGPLLHAAGSHVAGDLAGDLGRNGYVLRRVRLYESRTATTFSDAFKTALAAGAIDAVLLYSPRTAKTFATLAKQDDLRDSCAGVTAYCLSPAVADALRDLPFAAVRVAPRPEQDALLDLFDADTKHQDPEGERTMSDRPEAPGETSKKAETSTKQEAKEPAAGGPAPPPTKDKPAVKPATTADSAAKNGGSGMRRAALAVGAALLVLLIAYASLPWWRGALPPEYQALTDRILPAAEGDTALRGEVADLRDALGALRTSLRDLENRVAQQPSAPQQASGASPEDLAALRQQVEQLAKAGPGPDIEAVQTRITELENSRAPASAVLSLTERVSAVETQAREASSRQENALAFLMSVLQLREALLAGRPFDAELRAVRATAPQDFQLTSAAEGFIGYADTGVPPLVVLRQRLNSEADQIIRAAARPDEGNGWWNNTVDRALSVVSVRRTDGDAVGTDTASVVSRAEQRMAAGNLSGAVGELKALQGGPADAAAPWLRDANARLAADAATSELTAEALARVGARPQAAAANQEG